jgi:hypothetical protein
LKNSPICAIADPAAKCFETERSPMPRRSNASLTIAAFSPGPRRLEPPPELSEGSVERAIFIETVASVTPQHFAPEDRVLLAEYARTAALARRASEELAISPTIGDRASPWLEVHRVAAKTMMALTVRLRIGARSRNNHPRSDKGQPSPSAYDMLPPTWGTP